mgnify:CR=1 FL=1
MTPRQHKEFEEALKLEAEELAKAWLPKVKNDMKLSQYLEEMKSFALNPDDVPLVIKLVENPKYDIGLFSGATTLAAHDCVHVILGRGLLLKDEAFVIGYTMGSSKKMKRWRRNLFMFVCKYLYPKGYNFGEEERYVFYSGVLCGEKCKVDLTKIDFKKHADRKVLGLRKEFGIDSEMLDCVYCTEKFLFPNSLESQRL